MYQEWSCCMVRSAIVPGTLYLTERHICFYASLPQNPVSIEQGWGGAVVCVIDHASSQLNVTCRSTVIGRLDIFWSNILPRMALIGVILSSRMICWHGMKMLQTNILPRGRWISRKHLLSGHPGNVNLDSRSLL